MRLFDSTELSLPEIAFRICGELPVGTVEQREVVRQIVDDVRVRGDEALIEHIRRFDCPTLTLEQLRVTEAEFAQARQAITPKYRRALERAAANIRRYHDKQRPQDALDLSQPGLVTGFRFTPIRRVAIYVPGASAPFPSSVLMTAIPAQVAGVPELVMTTPAQRSGEVHPAILAAADMLGVHTVFKMGGAYAVAALAFGTESVPRVDKIAGPGNPYTNLAKQMVYGCVGIDGLYGPSEVVVVADGSADPALVAADLLSQAEHGADSVVVLVTPSRDLVAAVQAEIEEQLRPLSRQSTARECLAAGGALVQTRDLREAVELVNLLAPEHLQVNVEQPFALLAEIQNTGCILLGAHTPVAVGDYIAGPSHVLPTGRTARFCSGLGVADFGKRTSFIHASADWLAQIEADLAELASFEGFDAHLRAAQLRGLGTRDSGPGSG